MASINYILQLTAVRLSIVNKETDGLAMFDGQLALYLLGIGVCLYLYECRCERCSWS
jgi:hypothetical protein